MERDQVRATGLGRILPWLLGGIAVAAAAAHVLVALGGRGAMAVVMGAMGLLCLTCLPHLRATRLGIEKSALSLMFMSAAMALVHMFWIGLPLAGGHGHGAAAGRHAGDGHGTTMLGLIALELAALALSSTVLRINRSTSPGAARVAIHQPRRSNGVKNDQPSPFHLGCPSR